MFHNYNNLINNYLIYYFFYLYHNIHPSLLNPLILYTFSHFLIYSSLILSNFIYYSIYIYYLHLFPLLLNLRNPILYYFVIPTLFALYHSYICIILFIIFHCLLYIILIFSFFLFDPYFIHFLNLFIKHQISSLYI